VVVRPRPPARLRGGWCQGGARVVPGWCQGGARVRNSPPSRTPPPARSGLGWVGGGVGRRRRRGGRRYGTLGQGS
jgi:hypothetical protein